MIAASADVWSSMGVPSSRPRRRPAGNRGRQATSTHVASAASSAATTLRRRMRAVVQRVTRAAVRSADGESIGAIGPGPVRARRGHPRRRRGHRRQVGRQGVAPAGHGRRRRRHESLGRRHHPRDPGREPVHPLRRHPRRPAAVVDRGRAARAGRAGRSMRSSRACANSAPTVATGRFRTRHARRVGQRRSGDGAARRLTQHAAPAMSANAMTSHRPVADANRDRSCRRAARLFPARPLVRSRRCDR